MDVMEIVMIKVLVVDDHRLIRTGIARMLADERNIKVVGEASSGEEAVRAVRSLQPNVVLMDVSMPGIGGVEACNRILRFNPEVRVIALTVHADEQFALRFLRAGASGYLTKGVSAGDMAAAIQGVHAGQRHIDPEVAQRLALRNCNGEDSENPFDGLSERELQIATMVVNCEKVGRISEKLFLSPKTVNTYRYRLFEKLSIHSDVELVHLALRHGLLAEPHDCGGLRAERGALAESA